MNLLEQKKVSITCCLKKEKTSAEGGARGDCEDL